jgi:NADH-quinone oxidoreductase subunit G
MALEITVDGETLTVEPTDNLLQACLSAGRDIPYFCWHPSLGSVGACRQCAVKLHRDAADSAGRIVMACMTRPEPGMIVSIADPEAVTARDAVVEFVLANHPHDCPVCEVGGECHLQDMTALTGHHSRRMSFPKRTHRNQDLGPFIRHEMNRCIGCYRCVRFYQDYAGGTDFGVFGTAKNVFFGRAEDGALESPFAGNLVEVCPTGVFVDKPFSAKFRRKWDMRSTPSICPHCAAGCNITVHERDGVFRRVVNRHNPSLNGYFLCDRGRFGAGFLESPKRLLTSRDRYGKPVAREAAAAHLAKLLAKELLIGVGSPRASLESNFALRRLVGRENFYAGVSRHDAEIARAAIAAMAAVPIATLADAEQADAALILGPDPERIAPRLGLALRQAAGMPPAGLLEARDIPAWHAAAARTAAGGARNPFIVVSPEVTALDDAASHVLVKTPDKIAKFANAIAKCLDGFESPSQVREIADLLQSSASPVIVAGGSAAIITAAARLAANLNARGIRASLSPLLPAANSTGLACLDAPPFAACETREGNFLLLETDIIHAEINEIIGSAASLTCLDHIETATSGNADLAIAVASFADSDGTFINLEGRVQSFYKSVCRAAPLPAAWELLRDAAIAAGRLPADAWPNRAALLRDIADEFSSLAPCAAPSATEAKPPTLPHRYSGRTAAHAHLDVREPHPPTNPDSPYGTTMEGAPQPGPAPLVWFPGWNSNQAVQKLPQAAPDTFLFATKTPAVFTLPPQPWSYEAGDDAEEMSALSPAIIARRQRQ